MFMPLIEGAHRRALVHRRGLCFVGAWALCGLVTGCQQDRIQVDVDAALDAETSTVTAEDAAVTPAAPDDAGTTDAAAPAPTCTGPCPDGEFCDYTAHCRPLLPAGCSHCTSDDACAAVRAGCACDEHAGDLDGDGVPARACAGLEKGDCDDATPKVSPANLESCNAADGDSLARDEDCNPLTFARVDAKGKPVTGDAANGDFDGDEWVSSACLNFGANGKIASQGRDCLDSPSDPNSSDVHPNQPEVCDGALQLDNNCDGIVDAIEVTSEDPTQQEELAQVYFPDADGDGHAARYDDTIARTPAKRYYACPGVKHPEGTIAASPDDEDDHDARVHPGAPEVCDGKDNDQNGLADEADSLLDRPFNAAHTSYACTPEAGGAVWHLACDDTRFLFCGDPAFRLGDALRSDYARGCTTDGTSVDDCHACGARCDFACGTRACDRVEDLSAGGLSTCVRTRDGRVACWGSPADGRLAHTTNTASSRPFLAPELEGVSLVSVGAAHACAAMGDDDALVCWGANASGQLGVKADEQPHASPVRPVRSTGAALTGVAAIATSDTGTCAVVDATETGGALFCFGEQEGGRLGVGPTNTATILPRAARRRLGASGTASALVTDATSVTLGARHGCTLRAGSASTAATPVESGSVECWGNNTYGQLGSQGGLTASGLALPITLADGAAFSGVSTIAAGPNYTCALRSGEVWCWGDHSVGQLGPRDEPDTTIPGKVRGIAGAVALGVGFNVACAVDAQGNAKCWGDMRSPLLGGTGAVDGFYAIPGLDGLALRALDLGNLHGCALDTAGLVRCWGQNESGQRGLGTTSADVEVNKLAPVLRAEK